jgi:hypothetical protein
MLGGNQMRPPWLLIAIGLAGLPSKAHSQAPAGGQGSLAPSIATIVGEVQPLRDEQEIYITNRSSVRIIITSITIDHCDNATPCGRIALKIAVAPGKRVRVVSVRRIAVDWPYSYKYAWTWAADSVR